MPKSRRENRLKLAAGCAVISGFCVTATGLALFAAYQFTAYPSLTYRVSTLLCLGLTALFGVFTFISLLETAEAVRDWRGDK
jgi:hypothetical protein